MSLAIPDVKPHPSILGLNKKIQSSFHIVYNFLVMNGNLFHQESMRT